MPTRTMPVRHLPTAHVLIAPQTSRADENQGKEERSGYAEQPQEEIGGVRAGRLHDVLRKAARDGVERRIAGMIAEQGQ